MSISWSIVVFLALFGQIDQTQAKPKGELTTFKPSKSAKPAGPYVEGTLEVQVDERALATTEDDLLRVVVFGGSYGAGAMGKSKVYAALAAEHPEARLKFTFGNRRREQNAQSASPGVVLYRSINRVTITSEAGSKLIASAAFFKHVTAVLQEALKKEDARVRKDFEDTVAESKKDLQAYEKEREVIREQMQAKTGTSPAEPEFDANHIKELHSQKLALELEMVGLEARQRAIEERIRGTAEAISKAGKDDVAMAALERVVQLREEKLRQLVTLKAQGTVSSQELITAEEQVALAKAELVRQRESVARRMGGEHLAKLNVDLSDVLIKRAEVYARRKLVEERYENELLAKAKFEKLRRLDAKYRALDQKIADEQRLVTEYTQRLKAYQLAKLEILEGPEAHVP